MIKVTTRSNGKKRIQTFFEKVDEKTGEIIPISPAHASRAKQQFKDQTDANLIMKRFKKMGITYNSLPNSSGVYADLTQIPDLQASYDSIIRAESAFAALPSDIRNKFNNDPIELVKFLSDSKNDKVAVELGLKVPKKVDPVLSEEIAAGFEKANERINERKAKAKNALTGD